MPPAIVATVGSASANSYVTETEADTIAATFWPQATRWTSIKTEQRIPLLIEARRILDSVRFPGERVDDTQACEWPRNNVRKPSRLANYAGTEIPDPIKESQVRLAVWLEEFGNDQAAEGGLAGVTSLSIGSEISIGLDAAAAGGGLAGFMASTILPVLRRIGYSPQPRVSRG